MTRHSNPHADNPHAGSQHVSTLHTSTLPRHAVVTGSSSGIGRAVALRLAHPDARIVIHGAANQAGAAATESAARELGAETTVVMADLATESGRARLLEATNHPVPVDCWVHCAGVDVLTSELRDASFADKVDRLWEVDVRGTMLLARQAAKLQLVHAPANASMVFLGWDQASQGMEGDAGQMFGPIKAAITSFALHLAQDLAPTVRVNVVAPGWIRTAWGEATDPYWDQRARRSSLRERWGAPEDIAAAVAYLVSSHADFVTAQVLQLNGGWNRRFPKP